MAAWEHLALEAQQHKTCGGQGIAHLQQGFHQASLEDGTRHRWRHGLSGAPQNVTRLAPGRVGLVGILLCRAPPRFRHGKPGLLRCGLCVRQPEAAEAAVNKCCDGIRWPWLGGSSGVICSLQVATLASFT